jgi:DNA gyrase/topoisomerase IV subunit A
MRNKSEKIKTVSLSGLLIAENIFAHGDSSASETISRLAAPYLNNIPFFDGIGAFGTRVGPDSWGAPRYTYVKRGKASEQLLYPDLDIMPLRPNYDGSTLEPVNFLPLIPTVLLNGVSGIAVGWSTDILPHSLKSLIEATVAAIDSSDIPKLVPKHEYLNVGVKELAQNSYEFSGKVEIEGSTVIRVTELPPDLTLEKFKIRLNTMEEEGAINTYIDRSTKFINVEVRFKRGTIDGWTPEKAIDFLKLKSRSTQRIVVLDFNNKSIRQYETAEELVKSFVEWRVGWYKTRFEKIIADLTYELNFSRAIIACLNASLPKSLPAAQNRGEVETMVRKICEDITLDNSQIDRIVGFPGYRWAKDSVKKIDEEISDLTLKIKNASSILNDPKKIKTVYRKEVMALMSLVK